MAQKTSEVIVDGLAHTFHLDLLQHGSRRGAAVAYVEAIAPELAVPAKERELYTETAVEEAAELSEKEDHDGHR